VLIYFSLTFAVTWTLWAASGLTAPSGPHEPWFLLGVFSPGLVAVALTARQGGRQAVVDLLGRLVDWDVPLRWYVFAFGFMASVKVAAAVVHRAVLGAWPAFGTESWLVMVAATLISTVVGGQAGEELGWRGYALPRMADRLGFGAASVLLGMAWALWHLPLFFVPVGDTYQQSFPLYLLQLTALSVVMAWVYGRTRGSLLPMMLMHAAVNNTKDIVPSVDPRSSGVWAPSHSAVAWITVAILWAVASCCLMWMRGLPTSHGVTIRANAPVRR
jgi:membrane protease YdiL (CAAX protease family)